MGERALGWGLRLLGLALAIGPFIIALGMHNWDIQAAVINPEEIRQTKEMVGGLFGAGGLSPPTFQIPPPPYGEEVTIPVSFKSPFQFPITITDISGRFSLGDNMYRLRLEHENVYFQELENKTFNLIAQRTTESGPEEVVITFEVYGVTVRLQMGAVRGG